MSILGRYAKGNSDWDSEHRRSGVKAGVRVAEVRVIWRVDR